MNLHIRKLQDSDVIIAQELFVLFKKAFFDVVITKSDLPDAEYICSLLRKDNFHIFVAFNDEVVIGGVTLYELDMYMKKTKEAYLYDIGVDEVYRHRGVATALVDAIRLFGVERGIETIFVEASTGDVDAVAFYESLHIEKESVVHFNISTKK
jgi:aminoglycoside 3-N-acetyltransferase I